jgi:pimeloyl-ACP methyl ester carboxylesterase
MVAPSIDPALEPYEWFRAPMATPFIKWLLPRSIRASNDEIYKLKPQLEAMLPLWKNIKATTIVIQGTKDSLVDPKNADFAKKMIVAAPVSLVMIEGMDHFIPWSAPEKIRESVIELLDEYNDKY